MMSARRGDQHQRHQGEGNAEGEHHLAADQRVGGVEADREDEQRRRQGERATHEDAGCGAG